MPAFDLIQALQSYKLLSTEHLRIATELAATFPDSGKLGQELVERGILTGYQWKELAEGRGRELAISNYVVLEPLGKGGMGQVFRARDSVLRRVVALKLIRQDRLSSAQIAERFQREAQAAARLSHPNIVTIYHAG